jgi:signal transduction histidine kinase
MRSLSDVDPGWVLAEHTSPRPFDLLGLVADRPWWQAGALSGQATEPFQRLWRHSVAVSFAVRALAREAGDPSPDQLVRAGLLHGLGRWAVAAVDPQWIVHWLGEKDPQLRRRQERADLGSELSDLGRRLAQRWGCESLVVDAAWLHDQSGKALSRAAREPERMSLIQEAYRWAESTPWAVAPAADQESLPTEPRLRILIAEVQSRCGSLFVAADATSHEERVCRLNAGLLMRLAEAQRVNSTQQRLLQALVDFEPSAPPESWASRAGRVWCAEPEVTTARVLWDEAIVDDHPLAAGSPGEESHPPGAHTLEERTPALVFPLNIRGRARAEIHLWCDPAQPDLRRRLEGTPVVSAWQAWACQVADRADLERRLQAVVSAIREQADLEEIRTREAKLEALAEFAAGAAHELNNPLAVIVGRAQLLLGRTQDPDAIRSLRIILSQAQRSNRILRDLMFVARPQPERPRACRPSEVLRACISGFQEECDARGISLSSELEPSESPAWADPDALGHLAETLIRNAIQATPAGGRIQVRSARQGNGLRWWFCDSGHGLGPAEGAHLFDPFYCGRQAGRGLGLGLPRAARMVAQAGGTLNWSSRAGQGTIFEVQLPLSNPPGQMETRGDGLDMSPAAVHE